MSTSAQGRRRPDIAVAAEGLGRRYGRVWALRDLSLEVAAAETLLVVGSNGSGKSTLLRLILGLERPDTGSVRVFESDPRAGDRRQRRRVGALLHDDAVYAQLTVAETVELWRAVSGSRRTTPELIDAVGLARASDRPAAALSAGMRKRLALTRTLMIEPLLVVWDEPLTSLDSAGRELVLHVIDQLRRDGVSVIIASHERELLKSRVDQVLDLGAQPDAGRRGSGVGR